MFTICALFLTALAWTALGRVDIYATAPGKIVSGARLQVVQPEETARVVAIYVRDGSHVRRGERLIDLDETDTRADSAHVRVDLLTARIEQSRARAMLQAIDRAVQPEVDASLRLSQAATATEQAVLAGTLNDIRSNQARLKADAAQANAALRETGEEVQKLESTLPLEERKERDFAALAAKGFVGQHDYLNEQQAVIRLQRDLAEERAKGVEMQQASISAMRKLDAYNSDQRRRSLDKIHESAQKIEDLGHDLEKAERKRVSQTLLAPVSGTVQQLVVHTIGGVVTSAQPLLSIVPDDGGLEIEAVVNNRDIGFLQVGQEAQVKVESFPYARYGTLAGHVTQVDSDARQDEKLGLVFTAKLAMAADVMTIDERNIHLRPGMSVTVEIKTGRQRILGYLLSPLVQQAREGFHER